MIAKVRERVLHNDRLLGQDVIAAVQRETDLARIVFEDVLRGRPDRQSRIDLDAARGERSGRLQRLTGLLEFPPPPGALTRPRA